MALELPYGIRVASADPIDYDRYHQPTLAGRDALIPLRAEISQQVYVDETETLYVLKEINTGIGTWEVIGSAIVDPPVYNGGKNWSSGGTGFYDSAVVITSGTVQFEDPRSVNQFNEIYMSPIDYYGVNQKASMEELLLGKITYIVDPNNVNNSMKMYVNAISEHRDTFNLTIGFQSTASFTIGPPTNGVLLIVGGILETPTGPGTGLEATNQGAGVGRVFAGRDNDAWGPIGLNAIDMSTAGGSVLGATGESSFAIGFDTSATGLYSVASGESTIASGIASFSEGGYSEAQGDYSHAEGDGAIASGYGSHAEGIGESQGDYSHAEGDGAIASGYGSHAEGQYAEAQGDFSHAEGDSSVASGYTSHAEGQETTASLTAAHSEGALTIASGDFSHAEGFNTLASGEGAHAEGAYSSATGANSHAEGDTTIANGIESHAEGKYTNAIAAQSHAEGIGTIAKNIGSHAGGKYNIGTSTSTIREVGIGTGTSARKNAFEIYTDGTLVAPESTNSNIDSKGNKALLTKEYGDANYGVEGILSKSGNNLYPDVDRTFDLFANGITGGVPVILSINYRWDDPEASGVIAFKIEQPASTSQGLDLYFPLSIPGGPTGATINWTLTPSIIYPQSGTYTISVIDDTGNTFESGSFIPIQQTIYYS